MRALMAAGGRSRDSGRLKGVCSQRVFTTPGKGSSWPLASARPGVLRCARDGYVCNYTVRFALSFSFALLIMLRMFSQS